MDTCAYDIFDKPEIRHQGPHVALLNTHLQALNCPRR